MIPGEAVVLGALFVWGSSRRRRPRTCGRRVYVYGVGELRCRRLAHHGGRHVARRRGTRAVAW